MQDPMSRLPWSSGPELLRAAQLLCCSFGILAILWATSAPAAESVAPVATTAPAVITLPVEAGRDIRFRRTELEQGLSQTRVSHIVQDDQGFLWFGTQHGLNRFDGREYRLFKHEAGDPGSLSGVFIYALFKDRGGTLWVGSDQGLDAYDAATETFRHFRVDIDNPVVIHISQDNEGMLWLATAQGLYELDPATGGTRRFVHDPSDPSSLASNDVKSSGLDRSGAFWVATGEGLEAFDPKSGHAAFRIPLEVSVREFYFHEDRAGTFWIIYGSGNGLAQFDRVTNTVTRFAFQGGEAGGSGLTGVYAILEAVDGTIWLGTMGEGLLRYDRERRTFIAYRNTAGDLESLAENRVIALFEDSQQNIWVGLHASPPNAFAATKMPFERIVTPSYDPKAVGETLVNTVYADARGVLWVGAGGALGKIDRATGEGQAIAPPDGGPVEVLTIRENPTGVLWFGTLGRGLYRLNLDSGDMTSYRALDDAASLSSDIVTRIFVDKAGTRGWRHGTAWTGSIQPRGDPRRSSETLKAPQKGTSRSPGTRRAICGSEAPRGSTGFTPGTGAFQPYLHKSGAAETLSNNTVNTVLMDKQGALWVGTQNGLNLFDRERGTFRRFVKRDGLPGDVVSCLLEDGSGDLWMSTNNGMARLDRAALTFTSFSVADGLPGNDLSGWNACDKAPSGEMVFGGFSGATAFRPDQVSVAETQPPVLISEVRLGGAPLTPSELHPRGIRQEAVLDVPSGRDEIVVSYAALYFRAPSAVRYRYRLQGLDADWREVGSDQRMASYNALPAGAYRFEVQARTGRSGWSVPGAALTINVLPPWWQTFGSGPRRSRLSQPRRSSRTGSA